MKAVQDALALLVTERETVRDSLDRLDHAIEALSGIDTAPARRRGPSVRTRVLELAEEADRVWSPEDAVAELERRGTPVTGSDPRKQVKTALVNLATDRLLVRTAPRRYRAARFAADDAQPPEREEAAL
jgi:hypothetical protein